MDERAKVLTPREVAIMRCLLDRSAWKDLTPQQIETLTADYRITRDRIIQMAAKLCQDLGAPRG